MSGFFAQTFRDAGYTIFFKWHIFIVLMAVFDTMYFQQLYAGRLNYFYLSVVAAGTLIIYNLHYLLAWCKPDSRQVLMLFILLQLGIGSTVIYFKDLLNFFGLDPLIFWSVATGAMIYMMADFKALNIFNIPWIKPVLLTAVWFAVTAVGPAFEQELAASHQALLLHYLFMLLAICIVFDNKDVDTDRVNGISTLSIYLGFERTKIFALSVAAISFIPLFTGLPLEFLLVFSGISLLVMWLIFHLQPENKVSYYTVLLDGILGLTGLLGYLLLRYGHTPLGIRFF